MPIPDIWQAAIDVDPPKSRVPALIAAAGARVSKGSSLDENTGRRFRGWDISANVGVKLHAQVKDKMTRFMAEAAPHFAE